MITEEQFNQLLEKVSFLEEKVSELESLVSDTQDNCDALESRIADLEEGSVDPEELKKQVEKEEAMRKARDEERRLDRETKMNTVFVVKVHKKIASEQFCHQLYKGFSLPDTLEEIGRGVFGECDNIESIEIPASVTKIGSQFCKGCKRLKSVKFLGPCPEGLVGAFSGCKALEEVIVPEGEIEAYKAALTLVADKVK